MMLLECGTRVETIHGKIEGTITGISIRFKAVAYEISYFNNGEREDCWLNRCEFTVIGEENKFKIGFNKN